MARVSARRPQSPLPPRAMGRVNPVNFLQEVFSELRKSVWPTREETARLTVVVIVLAIAVGLFLGVMDRGFSFVFTRIIF